MDDAIRQEYQDQIRDLRLPRYEQIPNVGLYLEQAAKYISEYLAPLGDMALTGSMISNYVKKGLLASPVKKQYSREQICYLFFIAVAKTVMSMEDIRLMIRLQKEQYTPQKAYDYFCTELENALPACSPEEVDPVLRELARCKRRLLRTAPSPRRNRG